VKGQAGGSPSAAARERFESHRRAWAVNEQLRTLYGLWYRRIRAALPTDGPWIELGSGPGLARPFIPGMVLTDVVPAPWLDQQVSADAMPYAGASIGALVLLDVLHHLPAPARFFSEAARVLRRGGRVVMCEPYLSPLSYPIYRFLHEENLDVRADPLAEGLCDPGDPFDANQAIPSLLLGRGRARFETRFPELRITRFERLAGPSYPLSGGFSRPPLLPLSPWRTLLALEDRLPGAAFRLIGFRLLAVLERT
jgi:SAM-dependent methyltransferase